MNECISDEFRKAAVDFCPYGMIREMSLIPASACTRSRWPRGARRLVTTVQCDSVPGIACVINLIASRRKSQKCKVRQTISYPVTNSERRPGGPRSAAEDVDECSNFKVIRIRLITTVPSVSIFLRAIILGSTRFYVRRDRIHSRCDGKVFCMYSVYSPDGSRAEISLSTKEANESTTSSGGWSVLDSSPGLYFPVCTEEKGDDQSPEARGTLINCTNLIPATDQVLQHPRPSQLRHRLQ